MKKQPRVRTLKIDIPEPYINGKCRPSCPMYNDTSGCKYLLCHVKKINRGFWEDNLPSVEFYPGDDCPWGD